MRLQLALIARWLTALLSLTALAAAADDGPATDAGQNWAILIGCQKYERAMPLAYAVNDVEQLAATLAKRDGYPADHILSLSDNTKDARPTGRLVRAKLTEWLKKPGPMDRVLVFFSGHGVRDARDELYLAPLDIDPKRPGEAGIPVAWVREQLAACPAALKLLILDTCHAGSEKGDPSDNVPAGELGKAFGDLDKVVTIASSMADQESQEWPDKQQSLFSYWLVEALKGHADTSGDGRVNIDELYEFVETNVDRTAKALFAHSQTPVRIIRSGTPGSPIVATLDPQTLEQTLADMSEQLANAIATHQLKLVGVPEFANVSPGGDLVLGGDFGMLGRYCATELESDLVNRGAGTFRVLDGKRLTKLLQEADMGTAELASAQAIKGFAQKADQLPALVEGTLRKRAGSLLTLRSTLVETGNDKTIAQVGGIARLTASEWAMLGHSAALKADLTPSPSDVAPGQIVQQLDQGAENANPQVDPNFPFRVWLRIDGKLTPGTARGNDYLVGVRKGQVMKIWIEFRSLPSQSPIAMLRLLVDGLNTLPERSASALEPAAWGQRVNLGSARAWEIDFTRGETVDTAIAAGQLTRAEAEEAGLSPNSRLFEVGGFTTDVGPRGKLHEFVVVDTSQSLAARRKFTDQLGYITAAFYAPVEAPPAARSDVLRRSVAIGAGRERDVRIDQARGYACGDLLGVINIRYVDADSLAAPPAPQAAP